MAGFSSSTIGVVLSVCLVLTYLIRKYSSLRHIPGPFWAKFTDLQRVFYVKSGSSHTIHQKLHNKYGSLVRLGPNMVSVSDPEAIPTIYPTRPGFLKSKFYNAFIPYTPTGALPAIFTTQDENLHKLLKTPIASLYSLTNAVTFEGFIDEVTGILFEQLDKRFVNRPSAFDLSDWLQYFSFEVMGTMTFSKRYGFLEKGTDINGMLNTIWNFMLTIAPMTQIPWFDRLWNKNAVMIRFKKQSGNSILKIAADSTAERAQLKEKNGAGNDQLNDKDFLSRFLEIQANSESAPPWASTAWTFSNVIAGSDSTAVVMKTAMYHILANAETKAKLLQELDQAIANHQMTIPYPKWKEVSDLPYLDACVNEAIRVHPPFCLQLERIVPHGGVTICGQHFPAGSVVGMNPYVVNRHKPTFGEDADSWRPERWLEGGEDHKRKLEQSVMTFGAGRRVCLGKNIAMLEIKKIIPAMLLRYEFEMPDPSAYTLENSYFFRQRGICVRAQLRESAH